MAVAPKSGASRRGSATNALDEARTRLECTRPAASAGSGSGCARWWSVGATPRRRNTAAGAPAAAFGGLACGCSAPAFLHRRLWHGSRRADSGRIDRERAAGRAGHLVVDVELAGARLVAAGGVGDLHVADAIRGAAHPQPADHRATAVVSLPPRLRPADRDIRLPTAAGHRRRVLWRGGGTDEPPPAAVAPPPASVLGGSEPDACTSSAPSDPNGMTADEPGANFRSSHGAPLRPSELSTRRAVHRPGPLDFGQAALQKPESDIGAPIWSQTIIL